MSQKVEFYRLARNYGCITIPAHLREKLNLEIGDPIKVTVEIVPKLSPIEN